jgi:XTP/dITP diphosphohydrolase
VSSTHKRWVLATGNRGKVAELEALLHEAGIEGFEIIPQTELNVPAVAETAATFVENALQKARHAAAHTGLPAIADDSGLAVAALDGAPGIRSARFAGEQASDADNIAKLLDALANVPAGARAARFHCALVAIEHPDDPAPLIAEGIWRGEIAFRARGANGFGYDPVFFDATLGKTAAELSPAEKNAISHRGQALRELAAGLKLRG